MKKNKGFALIELLAIIAVITIPMIFNAIKKSKMIPKKYLKKSVFLVILYIE